MKWLLWIDLADYYVNALYLLGDFLHWAHCLVVDHANNVAARFGLDNEPSDK